MYAVHVVCRVHVCVCRVCQCVGLSFVCVVDGLCVFRVDIYVCVSCLSVHVLCVFHVCVCQSRSVCVPACAVCTSVCVCVCVCVYVCVCVCVVHV